MDRQRWQHIQAIFEEALRQDTAGLAAFVDGACGADAALRAEVLTLLAHEAQAGHEEFLQPPRSNPAIHPPDEIPIGAYPPARLADYEILGELGRGGTSVVYRARQVRLNRLVALKMLLTGEHAGADELARFRGEARALARLQHPNIVQIHDVGEHDGRPYFALELVDGGSLKDHLDGTPLPPRQAAELVQTLARAIHAAHQCGIVHRDLKPGNVLLQRGLTQRRKDAKKDEGGEDERDSPTSSSSLGALASLREALPKITDFGLAKRLDESGSGTQSGAFLGTPSYTPPEQAEGQASRIGPASDVYGLGAILYELLTGRPPFRAETTLETLRQVTTVEPASPRSLAPRLPRDLETICLTCLEKEPGRRYASALALAEDLRRFLAGEPTHARPASALRRAAHWLRRHPAAASALAAGLLLALTITLGAVWHSAQLGAALEGEQRERLAAQWNEGRARQSEARAGQTAYASDVRLANQLLRTGDIYHLADLLDRHLPAEGADDRREFAWYYARQFGRPSPPPPLAVHRGAIVGVAFSGDGRLLITNDESVRVWEMPAGRCRLTLPSALEVTPTWTWPLAARYPDGRILALVPPDREGCVRLLDLATGQERALLQHPPHSKIGRLLLSADGRTLATVANDVVRFWDAQSFQPRGQFLETDGLYLAQALSADGRTLATVTQKSPQVVRLQDVPGGAIRREMRPGVEVLSLVFSPKGDLLAASLRDGSVALFRASGGGLVERRVVGPLCRGVMAFAPDGRRLAVGMGEEVRLWDLRDGTSCVRLRWQASAVRALAFSPDGQVLAVGTEEGLVHRINADCLPAHDTLRADLRPSGPLAVSHDGKTLALPDEDGTVKLVDAVGGEVRLTLPGNGGRTGACAFAPDDRTLAMAGVQDAEVRLWNTITGQENKRIRAGAVGITSLAFSPVGGLLAAGDDGGVIWVWDPATGERRGRLAGQDPSVTDLAFSGDGRILACCNGSENVPLWDVPPQGPLPDLPREKVTVRSGASAVAFAPTGRTLAVGEGNGLVHVLSVPEAGPARPVGLPLAAGAGAPITFLAFAPDGRSLLVSRDDRNPVALDRVTVWDVASAAVRISTGGTRILAPAPHAAAWMPDGRLLGRTADGDVQIRNLNNGSVQVPPGQALWPVWSLAFSPDGRSLYVGTGCSLGDIWIHQKAPPLPLVPARYGGVQQAVESKGDVADAVRLWDVESLAPGTRLPGEQTWGLPGRIALSADGRLLAAGGPDGSVRVWDLPGQRLVTRLFISEKARRYALAIETAFALWPGKPQYKDNSEDVLSLAFSPDRRWLAALGDHGSVVLWVTDGWQEHHPLAGPQDGAAWLGFSPDSSLAVACQGQVRLCDPHTGEVRATLGAGADPPVLCGAFAPDGHLLATGTADQTVRVWDLRAATESRALTGHMNQVAAVAFSPDGKTLASGDWSGAVKLWSAVSLREVASLEGHGGKVRCLAFSPDGKTLATGAEVGLGRGEVFLWRAPSP
jgi:WD40 repeat protein/serine/threonine protein kinase